MERLRVVIKKIKYHSKVILNHISLIQLKCLSGFKKNSNIALCRINSWTQDGKIHIQLFISRFALICESKLKKNTTINKYWWKVHYRFPQIYYSHYPREESLTSSIDDERENKAYHLPSEESVDVLMFWAIEAYGPSEIDNFYSGIEALGWNTQHLGNSDCIDWVKSQRQVGTSGTFNVGFIVRPGENRLLPRFQFADVPLGVKYLVFKIDQVCPSLTSIQVGFVLDSDYQKAYEIQLHQDYQTVRKPLEDIIGAYQYLDPSRQKEISIESTRLELRALASNWIRSHFPGIFSNSSNYLPTAELIVTKREMLLQAVRQSSVIAWPRIMANVYPFNIWKSEKYESLQLGNHESDNQEQLHIVVTLAAETIPDEALKHYGGRSNSALAPFVNEHLDGLLVRFSLLALLNTFRRDLMKTRDKLKIDSPHKRRALKSLFYIQRFFSGSVQVPSVVSEIADLTENHSSHIRRCSKFKLATQSEFEDDESLGERIASITYSKASRLLQDDRATRESFKQISEVVTARESIRAQRRMEILTLITICLAALSFWIALPANVKSKLLNCFQVFYF